MLKVLPGEVSKGYGNKSIDITIKCMDKYAQLKRLHHDLQLQVYMYAFMYVDTVTMKVEDRFPTKKTFVEN